VNPEPLEFFRDGYANLFPDCPIHLSGGNSLHMLQRLQQESLDGALLAMPIDGPDWVTQQLAGDPLVLLTKGPFSIPALLRDQLREPTGLRTLQLFTTKGPIIWLCRF
jgi:DNA-binding transcriptional LysR family regulator